MSEEQRGFWETFARRPSIVELVGSGLISLVILVATSNTGWDILAFTLTFLAVLALVGLWCLHWVMGLVARARGTLRSALTAREWLAWAVLPILLFASFVQLRLDLSLRLRFALSRSAFEEYDRGAIEGEPGPEGLGLYSVERVQFLFGRPHITTNSSLFSTSSGFVRWPDRPPRERGELRYHRLWGDWYTFYWSD